MSSIEVKNVLPEAIDRELSRIGWTRYRLAQVTGISHSTMSNICNGVHDPKVSNLKAIADALGVTVDSLLGTKSSKSKNSRRAVATVA